MNLKPLSRITQNSKVWISLLLLVQPRVLAVTQYPAHEADSTWGNSATYATKIIFRKAKVGNISTYKAKTGIFTGKVRRVFAFLNFSVIFSRCVTQIGFLAQQRLSSCQNHDRVSQPLTLSFFGASDLTALSEQPCQAQICDFAACWANGRYECLRPKGKDFVRSWVSFRLISLEAALQRTLF